MFVEFGQFLLNFIYQIFLTRELAASVFGYHFYFWPFWKNYIFKTIFVTLDKKRWLSVILHILLYEVLKIRNAVY